MVSRFEHFKDEEVVLRSMVVQRGRPPLPPTLPPKDDPDKLCSSMTSLSMVSSTSSSCNNDDEPNTSTYPLKFERRIIPRADSSLNGQDPFIALPWNVMYQIFSTFELRDRLNAARVCRRWNRLLTDGRFPLGEVSVLNLFEKQIWDLKLSQNITNGGKVECISLTDFNQIKSIFVQCTAPRVVKIWYTSLEFLAQTLNTMSNCELKLHSLDIYPYGHYVGASLIHEYLPNLKHVSMRPHGTKYFFIGMNMEHFPEFSNLESLSIDSFNLIKDSKLPVNLKNLDWQCRNEDSLPLLIYRLETLKQLEYLTIGHANFDNLNFLRFIQNIGFWNMGSLQYLSFKLVKFKIDAIAMCNDFSSRVLHGLKVLRMELCYGNLPLIMNLFLQMTGHNLKILSLSLMTGDREFMFKDLFDMSSELKRRGLHVHLSLMDPSDTNSKEDKNEKKDEGRMPRVPLEFAHLMTKFEASFVTLESTLNNILGAAYFQNLTEIKLIQCQAADDKLLFKIAQNCPQLERLSVHSCHDCTNVGIKSFVETFHQRQSDVLKIIWQQDQIYSSVSFITDLYLDLTNESPWLCDGLNIRSKRKQFRAKFGEQIAIWNEDKMMYIQNFDNIYDQQRVLGIVLPTIDDHRNRSTQIQEDS